MPKELIMDHPFLFRLINDTSVVFIGSHIKPSFESDEDDMIDFSNDPQFDDTPRSDDGIRNHKPSHCEL